MKAKPDGGMFGVKVIRPVHLDFACFWQPLGDGDGLVNLMNFRNSLAGRARARNIPNGHRMLVYVASKKRFVAAVEVCGSLEDGAAAAALHADDLRSVHPEWTTYRPVRFLARVPLAEAPASAEVGERCGWNFRTFGAGHQYISAEDFRRGFEAIDWRERY